MSRQPTLAESVGNIPPIARFFTVSTLSVCMLISLGIIDPQQMIFHPSIYIEEFEYTKAVFTMGTWTEAVKSVLLLVFECYRCFTSFLVPAGFLDGNRMGAVLDIYFFYKFANNVEIGKFKGNFPDCLWFTLICGTSILTMTVGYYFYDPTRITRHHESMLLCITYIWARGQKNSIVNFLGIVPIKAYYLPMFTLFIKAVVHGYDGLVDSSMGIAGGYLYQCLQSSTAPIYNLFPQFYRKFYSSSIYSRNRVGTNQVSLADDFINDTVFDRGYLPAPSWVYSILKYPVDRSSKRITAFGKPIEPVRSDLKSEASATTTGSYFKGRGFRLGS
ncbi:hypothetical protein PSN45_001233 [Yamadazyma tenuis]|uniref:Derlin n=1 Tax=Candida tenuis (strain ATCC 10573 / BCRC 21748 / CBS 615 / JCM 9827 / NBRC 10315 / NRRL Y-1498 / VKM Y-70) TaxID=590646 RepID=G3B964_CANTC|nr:uncharacterized protein CANTEDRAFT_115935 [Yamadazyma tenuis ATCC 10573]XP_006689108.1 uncharacterized protein CANTEDRAFT_115935 [Yamadazyma tenuis ATCC 10573]EGV62937.1 hypothetical protein CANTEDRAFT_115935 [Yamadazyma tenuis ATCC 10573]EGV62938.1 hypothetical protein CANTEDRAFT_115935 [Yamadazyma tenuis ATCC 10573]WEJ93759.1 hypothetical protein PSN45_001233 [Yamadazyma tenuis]